jgi:MFS transporter, PPP family, 3-phenylpropionic acid transporter
VTILPAVVRERSTPRLIAIGLYVFAFAAVGAYTPYLPVYFSELGLPLDAIGLVAALAALCALIAAPVWGVLADQVIGARTALVAAAALGALCAMGVGFTTVAVLAAIIAVLYQLAFAGVAPVLDAYALDQVGDDQHRYSRLRVWGSASFVVSVVAVGVLVQQTEIRAMFVVLVGCLVAAAVVASLVPARTSAHAQRNLSGLGVVLRTRVLMTFVGAALVVWSASTMVNGFYSIYLISLNAPAGLVGSAWALGALVEVPLMIVFPALAARLGVGRLVVVGAGFLLLRAIVVVVFADPMVVVAAMALHGAGFALLLVGGVTYVASRAPTGSAATAQGVLAGVVFGLAQAIGPGVAGFIAGATSIHAMFTFAAVASALGLVAVGVAVSSGARSARPALMSAATDSE